jgi:hypothetical protein
MPCHVVDNDITPSLQWVTTSRQQAGNPRHGGAAGNVESCVMGNAEAAAGA